MMVIDDLERHGRFVATLDRAIERIAVLYPPTRENGQIRDVATIAALVCDSMLSDPATLARAIHALPDGQRQAVLVLTDALSSGATR